MFTTRRTTRWMMAQWQIKRIHRDLLWFFFSFRFRIILKYSHSHERNNFVYYYYIFDAAISNSMSKAIYEQMNFRDLDGNDCRQKKHFRIIGAKFFVVRKWAERATELLFVALKDKDMDKALRQINRKLCDAIFNSFASHKIEIRTKYFRVSSLCRSALPFRSFRAKYIKFNWKWMVETL